MSTSPLTDRACSSRIVPHSQQQGRLKNLTHYRRWSPSRPRSVTPL